MSQLIIKNDWAAGEEMEGAQRSKKKRRENKKARDGATNKDLYETEV